jgi:hypothetical protein
MTERAKLEWPQEGLAIVTVNDAATPNHNITFATVSALADCLTAAREGGARVTVLASAVPGEWLNHARLGDLRNLVQGKPTGADRQTLNFLRFGATLAPDPGSAYAVSQLQAA